MALKYCPATGPLCLQHLLSVVIPLFHDWKLLRVTPPMSLSEVAVSLSPLHPPLSLGWVLLIVTSKLFSWPLGLFPKNRFGRGQATLLSGRTPLLELPYPFTGRVLGVLPLASCQSHWSHDDFTSCPHDSPCTL